MRGPPLDRLVQVTSASLGRVLDRYADHVVLDVRTDNEWEPGHIEEAIHVPIATLVSEGGDLDDGISRPYAVPSAARTSPEPSSNPWDASMFSA